MSDQKGVDKIKSAEEVMKWKYDDSIKVMLIQNIVNGNLKFEDPKLVEFLKSMQPNGTVSLDQTPQPSQSPFYEAEGVVTNMVIFNGRLCYSIKDSPKIFVNNLKGKITHNDCSFNIKHLAVGNGYLYYTDIKNRVIACRFIDHHDCFVYVNELTSRDKEITSIFAGGDKLYIGFSNGSVQIHDKNLHNAPIDLTVADNKPICHIIQFGKWMVYTSNKNYYIYNSSTHKQYEYGGTAGGIISLKIVNNILHIFTRYGILRCNENCGYVSGSSLGYFYTNDELKTNVLIHGDNTEKMIISLETGGIVDRDGKDIVRYSSGSNIVMLIHENKLYSSGSDKIIKVTPMGDIPH